MKVLEFGLYIWAHPGYVLLLSLVVSFIIVYTSIPSIVTVAHCKGLYDEPDPRKSHFTNIPNLGGIGIFAGLIITTGIFAKISQTAEFAPIMAAMIVLFFIGIKDDILVIAPTKKLFGEIIAAFIITVIANLRFTSLHGFMGINAIPYSVSVLLTIFVMVVIINAFNLIDGIDGLSSSLGIVAALIFGLWFKAMDYHNYAILAAALAGSLSAFFIFNVFGKRNKVFMGDTGSLLVGLTVSVLVIKFNQANIAYSGAFHVHAAPAVSFGIIIVPMFDTLRVFTIRILRKRSPFSPDKNHLHHRLLKIGFSHIASSGILVAFNLLIVGVSFWLQELGIFKLMLVNLAVSGVFALIMEYYARRSSKKETVKMVSTAVSQPMLIAQ